MGQIEFFSVFSLKEWPYLHLLFSGEGISFRWAGGALTVGNYIKGGRHWASDCFEQLLFEIFKNAFNEEKESSP